MMDNYSDFSYATFRAVGNTIEHRMFRSNEDWKEFLKINNFIEFPELVAESVTKALNNFAKRQKFERMNNGKA